MRSHHGPEEQLEVLWDDVDGKVTFVPDGCTCEDLKTSWVSTDIDDVIELEEMI